MKKMIQIPSSVYIHPTARIEVEEGSIGERTIISAHATIEGRYVKIGTESWIGEYASIGGGSCFDSDAFLNAGDWLHLGPFAHINTARGVTIGNEVGIGWRSGIFTHGAYESCLDGFPVEWGEVVIGDRVWLPHAWVNPNVVIGNDVVVAAMSLVNQCLPSGCLAGGIPVKILKENVYPNAMTPTGMSKLKAQIIKKLDDTVGKEVYTALIGGEGIALYVDGHLTSFDFKRKTISGTVNGASEVVKEQLRRNGIRFRYYAKDGEYVKW